MIENVRVYGLGEAFKGSKYPMTVDISMAQGNVTENIKKLSHAPCGSGHDTFLQGIIVIFDVAFTIKAWTEAERYHFLDFVSSQSTMHRLQAFDLDSVYDEHVDSRIIDIMKELQAKYNETKDKEDFLKLAYSNPCGMKLTAKMVTNYRQLKTIYFQRKDHKLPEWREFCKDLEELPYFKELIL